MPTKNRIALLLVLGFVVCVAQTATARQDRRLPPRPRPRVKRTIKPATGPCTLSPELLTSTEWRIYMPTLQVPRAAGIPIRLTTAGTVVSDDISWLRKWQSEDDGTVTLLEEDGKVAYRFHFDGERCVLTSLECENPQSDGTVMGPRGTDFVGYLAAKCPERFGKREP